MQIIDKNQTILWLSEHGVLCPGDLPHFSGFVQAFRAAIPPDSGRKTALSRVIASFFNEDEEALLWINEFGIWPSSEDQFLFEGFRKSLGEVSPLYEKPGHIFSRTDLRAVGSLVALILYFSWGGVLYSPARGLAIRISHDEFMSVFVRDRSDAADVAERLERFL